MSENSHLHHLSAQVSQVVFYRVFDRFTVIYSCNDREMVK